jgi:mono/diheme cytochrome c family protein
MHSVTKALVTLSIALAGAGCAAPSPSSPTLIPPPTSLGHPMPDGQGGHAMMPGMSHEDMAATPGHAGGEAGADGHDAPQPAAGVDAVPIDDTPRSFRTEVVPILRKHCAGCHTEGRGGAQALTMFNAAGEPQHEAVKENIGRMLLEIQSGRMPKGKPDSLTQDEFDTLDMWGAAEMPNN